MWCLLVFRLEVIVLCCVLVGGVRLNWDMVVLWCW